MKIIRKFKTERKKVGLTFDDGPDMKNTVEILNILSEYKVKATFFVTGKNAEKFPELVELAKGQGHEIGNHSFSHSSLRFKTLAFVYEEITKTDNLLSSIGIGEVTNFRPPYGRYFPFVPLALKRLKKSMILWNIGPKDYKAKSSAQLTAFILKKLKPGSIIVLHDGGGNRRITIEALKELIPEILKKGYQFCTITEMSKGCKTKGENL